MIGFTNYRLMRLFEAGILDKMTASEYEKMFGVQNRRFESPMNGNQNQVNDASTQNEKDVSRHIKDSRENMKLEPISVKMLKGAFFILLTGYALAALVLIFEYLNRKYELDKKFSKKHMVVVRKIRRQFRRLFIKLHDMIYHSS